jgi:beta-phosphoglucomutase
MTDGNPIKAALFDLDGVLVSTDCFHYQAWKIIADEEHIYFDTETNHRLRGVSRMESLEIILEQTEREYTLLEKEALCERKNGFFKESITTLTSDDWLAGSITLLGDLQSEGVKLALCSSSKNAHKILDRLEGANFFDVIVDGNEIARTKPDPQIFLLASERLAVEPADCIVFEDAESGIEAAKRAKMRCVGVGNSDRLKDADITVENLSEITAEQIFRI